MPIVVKCPECAKSLRVADNLAGKLIKCPACSAKVRVEAAPEPPAVIEVMPAPPQRPPQMPAQRYEPEVAAGPPVRREPTASPPPDAAYEEPWQAPAVDSRTLGGWRMARGGLLVVQIATVLFLLAYIALRVVPFYRMGRVGIRDATADTLALLLMVAVVVIGLAGVMMIIGKFLSAAAPRGGAKALAIISGATFTLGAVALGVVILMGAFASVDRFEASRGQTTAMGALLLGAAALLLIGHLLYAAFVGAVGKAVGRGGLVVGSTLYCCFVVLFVAGSIILQFFVFQAIATGRGGMSTEVSLTLYFVTIGVEVALLLSFMALVSSGSAAVRRYVRMNTPREDRGSY